MLTRINSINKFHINQSGPLKSSKRQNNINVTLKKPTFRENIREFCSNTTFHGLKFISNGHISYTERLFFAISFLLVSTGVVYFTWRAYRKWSETPVFIGINPTPTFINEIPFPAVTICNMNQAMLSKVKMFDENSEEYALLQILCGKENDIDYSKINFTINSSLGNTNWRNFENFIYEVAQPCDEMMLQCKFASVPMNCSEIFQPVLTDEGLCCTFNAVHLSYLFSNKSGVSYPDDGLIQAGSIPVDWNPEKGYPEKLPPLYYPRKASGTGVTMGLSLVLNANIDDYYCSSTNGAGFKIAIHSPIEMPHIKETGINVEVGVEARIRITPELDVASKTIRSINIKNRHCVFNDERYLHQFNTYTRRNCEMECEAEMLARECNCIRYYMPIIQPNITICGLDHLNCANVITLVSRLTFVDDNINCNEMCLPSCFDLSYQQDVFSTPIHVGNFHVKDNFLKELSVKSLQKSMAILNFFYKENAFYGKKKEEFTGMTEFLSDTGGLLGLFLGFSCISLVEVFYYVTLRPLCAKWRYKKQKGNIKKEIYTVNEI